MKRRIVEDEDDKSITEIDDVVSTLKDDFDCAIPGLEHLERPGANASSEAPVIAETLGNNIQSAISSIASVVE